MLSNLHTHTSRCNHAVGTEQEYVENAISMGMKILGFSDHTPYVFPGNYYSNFRMKLHELDDYAESVLCRHLPKSINLPWERRTAWLGSMLMTQWTPYVVSRKTVIQ